MKKGLVILLAATVLSMGTVQAAEASGPVSRWLNNITAKVSHNEQTAAQKAQARKQKAAQRKDKSSLNARERLQRRKLKHKKKKPSGKNVWKQRKSSGKNFLQLKNRHTAVLF